MLENAVKWKKGFDNMTAAPDEPEIPCALFINHVDDNINDNRIESTDFNQIKHYALDDPNAVQDVFIEFIRTIIMDQSLQKRR